MKKDKLVIFDWGGIVESNFQDEYNCDIAKKKVVTYFNRNYEKYNTSEIVNIWNQCSCNEDGKYISEINDEKNIISWIERLSKKFNLNCTSKEFISIYKKMHADVNYLQDVVDYAHSLKNKCKIGVLSNIIKLDEERIDEQFKLKKFDYIWLSFMLNTRKPNNNIYEIVEKEIDMNPENILFIDNEINNLIPAKKRGWNVSFSTGRELNKIKQDVERFLSK